MKKSSVAVRSLSRRLLVRLIALRPDLCRSVASDLGISDSRLSEYRTGERLMSLDVQERLAAFALTQEPALSRDAHQLTAQVRAARRYEAGEVVRHLTSPPRLR